MVEWARIVKHIFCCFCKIWMYIGITVCSKWAWFKAYQIEKKLNISKGTSSIFRFYLGHDSVVILKNVGCMENLHNQVELRVQAISK